MDYKDVLKALKDDALINIFLFYGVEHYLLEHTLHEIKNKLVGDGFEALNFQMLDGKETTVEQLVNACETLPFMGSSRLIVVKDLECFSGKRKNITEEDEQRLQGYLGNIPATTYLIFVSTEDIDKRKKIVKTIGKLGEIIEFSKLEGAEIKRWVHKSFHKLGKTIEEKELSHFIEATGYNDRNSDKNLKDLENEIKKISNYLGERRAVTVKDIELLTPKTMENNIFSLVESIGEKDGEKALLLLHEMLLEGEPEIRILFMIIRQFRLLYQIKLMESQGYTAMAIAPKLGLQQFIVKKYLRQAANFDTNVLRKALFKCLDTDEGIKKGKLEPRLAIELLISEFTVGR